MAYRLEVLRIREQLEDMKKTVNALKSRVDAIDAALDALKTEQEKEE
jgi:CII-binding regulator of phage lambda lysogenization HflD